MSTRLTLSNVRLNFEHIFEPSSFDEGQAAKYSADLIIPKNHPDVPALKRAFYAEGHEMFPNDFDVNRHVWPKGYSCSLKDADVDTDNSGVVLSEKYPDYKGCYILKANSTRRPQVVNRNAEPITADHGVIYPGCYVYVKVGIRGFTFGKMTKGVKAYLNGVQFYRDGERLGGAADMFDALDGEDDDFFN